MAIKIKAPPAKVISIGKPKKDTRRESEKKYGKPVMDYGFCIVPSLLMQAQGRLGLNPAQFNIIMQLADMWWTADQSPWPTKKLIADRLGMSDRQVQRHLADLENNGLIERIGRTRPGRGKTSNVYDLGGLVERLRKLEPEFTKARDDSRKLRSNVQLPKHKRKA
jgi:DNA-binding transcriptional ArsR family regulator